MYTTVYYDYITIGATYLILQYLIINYLGCDLG